MEKHSEDTYQVIASCLSSSQINYVAKQAELEKAIKDRDRSIYRARESGWTIYQIALTLGISRREIDAVIQKLDSAVEQ